MQRAAYPTQSRYLHMQHRPQPLPGHSFGISLPRCQIPAQVIDPGSRTGRTVLQAGTTPVTTPVQLQTAVASGARHIIVQQHMDLSSLQPAVQDVVLGIALNTTFSVTVRLHLDIEHSHHARYASLPNSHSSTDTKLGT